MVTKAGSFMTCVGNKDYTQTHLPCNLMSVQVAICIYLSYAFAVIEEMNASSFSVAMYGHPNLRDCNRNV